MAERKLPKLNKLRVIGAIITKYLLAHRVEIMNELAQVRLAAAVGTTVATLREVGLSPPETPTPTRASEDEDARGAGGYGSSR